MDEPTDQRPPPAEWIEALARGEAQILAGETVPGALVHRRIQEALARLEARLAGAAEPRW